MSIVPPGFWRGYKRAESSRDGFAGRARRNPLTLGSDASLVLGPYLPSLGDALCEADRHQLRGNL